MSMMAQKRYSNFNQNLENLESESYYSYTIN
jgi:hypothetical protein